MELIKGTRWENTGAPAPFRSGRRHCSHDTFYKLGRKSYGLTTADSDCESVLLEDYGSHIAIWNAYERKQILISPELAAAIKAKIEYSQK